MSELAAAFAKLAGIRKGVQAALDELHGHRQIRIENFRPDALAHYFAGAVKEIGVLRKELPSLYSDFGEFPAEPLVEMAVSKPGEKPQFHYARAQLQRLVRDVDQVFEIRSNSELATPSTTPENRSPRVFISHGRAPDWREVQAFLERDVRVATLELAQEPNLGNTVLTKLVSAAEQCNSAVIVMTGDDQDAEGNARARENVIHEVGYFQGKYGLARVFLLHEEGVNIPSNIHGLVYAPFPKGVIQATFGVLMREIGAMYRR